MPKEDTKFECQYLLTRKLSAYAPPAPPSPKFLNPVLPTAPRESVPGPSGTSPIPGYKLQVHIFSIPPAENAAEVRFWRAYFSICSLGDSVAPAESEGQSDVWLRCLGAVYSITTF